MGVVDIALKSDVISSQKVMTLTRRSQQSALVGGCFFLGQFGVPAGHYSSSTDPSTITVCLCFVNVIFLAESDFLAGSDDPDAAVPSVPMLGVTL
jgi:hypothetical protein